MLGSITVPSHLKVESSCIYIRMKQIHQKHLITLEGAVLPFTSGLMSAGKVKKKQLLTIPSHSPEIISCVNNFSIPATTMRRL